jgi:hypothetical protein
MHTETRMIRLAEQFGATIPTEKTNCYRVLRYLSSGKRLSNMKAYRTLNQTGADRECRRLKEKFGWPIEGEFRNNGRQRFKEYWFDTTVRRKS